jgi:hypothetical protein
MVGNDPNAAPPGLAAAPDSPPWTSSTIAVNKGYNPALAGQTTIPNLVYLPKGSSPIGTMSNDWWWGPSSDHGGGIVAHCFADGHVLGVTEQCDGATYLGLVTRNGQEPIDDTKIN